MSLEEYQTCFLQLLNCNVNTSNERKWFHTKKGRWYPAETITDADYIDDLALIAKIPAQANTLS